MSNHMNSRCQVDLVDMQSEQDGDHKFILNYQDHLTKFIVLRSLKTKTAEEVAYNLIDIFCLLGAPFILQCDNGREFANRIISSLAEMWPQLKIVHGKPRHSQNQGSVERSNQDVRDMLICWMADENSRRWSEGLRFVQSKKNRSYHSGINRSPYEAMFGSPQRIGLRDSNLPQEIVEDLISEEDLERATSVQTPPSSENNDLQKTVETQQNAEVSLRNKQTTVNQLEENSEINKCIVCTKEVTGAHNCITCQKYVHVICGFPINNEEGYGSEVQCSLCRRQKDIEVHRVTSKHSLESQAQKMLMVSNKKFKPVKAGENVLIRVPDVDRGRTAPRNVIAMVKETTKDGLYQLATKEGVLERLYARNEFQKADSTFHEAGAINTEVNISLRHASATQSGSSQGFVCCK